MATTVQQLSEIHQRLKALTEEEQRIRDTAEQRTAALRRRREQLMSRRREIIEPRQRPDAHDDPRVREACDRFNRAMRAGGEYMESTRFVAESERAKAAWHDMYRTTWDKINAEVKAARIAYREALYDREAEIQAAIDAEYASRADELAEIDRQITEVDAQL